MKSQIIAAFTALSLTAIPAAAFGQDSATAASTNIQASAEHIALATAMTSDATIKTSFDTAMVVGFEGVLRAEAELVEMDTQCPGLIRAMSDAVRPTM